MSFGDHISWLGKLSSQASFESEKLKFLKGATWESNQIDSSKTKVDKERGRVEGFSYSPEANNVEEFSNSFDDFILQKTKRYTGNYISSIIEPIAQDDIKIKIGAWIKILEHTKLQVEEKDYYESHPGYKKSISISIKVLQQGIESDADSSDKYGEKQQKAYELQPYLDKIENADSHEQAVAILNKECSKFSWDRPQKKLIFSSTGKLNKSQASYALQEIAKIKWPDSHPSAETIRKTLLK